MSEKLCTLRKIGGGKKLLTQLELISSFTISVGQTMSVPLTQKYSAYLFRMPADDMDNLVWINPNSPTSTSVRGQAGNAWYAKSTATYNGDSISVYLAQSTWGSMTFYVYGLK